MILFYIDEGGTGWKDQETNFFFLVSFAVPAYYVPEMDRELRSLKQSWLSGDKLTDWELKGRDIWQGQGKFKNVNQKYRCEVFLQLAQNLSQSKCSIFAIVINKKLIIENQEQINKDVKRYIKNDTDLYQLSFEKMLDLLNNFLKTSNQTGILLMDSRSTSHNSVQDGRLVKVYQDWIELQEETPCFIEKPWFGFSEFYTGLQLADYVTYLLARRVNEKKEIASQKLQEAFDLLESKIYLLQIPDPPINFEDDLHDKSS
jgi:hypothetical protein